MRAVVLLAELDGPQMRSSQSTAPECKKTLVLGVSDTNLPWAATRTESTYFLYVLARKMQQADCSSKVLATPV